MARVSGKKQSKGDDQSYGEFVNYLIFFLNLQVVSVVGDKFVIKLESKERRLMSGSRKAWFFIIAFLWNATFGIIILPRQKFFYYFNASIVF